MNWGNKLVVVFVGFATFIGTLVYKATTTKFDLVTKDYYKEELRYQDQIDGMANAAKVSAVTVAQGPQALMIQFPKEMKGTKLEGQVWVYCKTDAENDKKIAVTVDDSGKQLILKKGFPKGAYQLKINWKAGGESFYTQKDVLIN
ncbi:MAG: FixH family protein [Bacteroidota bacterium]|nr:FixH family protein [Bacteroidota bacterium]